MVVEWKLLNSIKLGLSKLSHLVLKSVTESI